MINNVVLVGRIVEEPTMKNFDGEFKGAFITLAVSRPFKNFDNKIETDFIKVAFWEGLAENAYQYCHKGDVIGVRGRLSTRKDEIKFEGMQEAKTIYNLNVVGERIVFISSSRKKTEVDFTEQN